MITLYHGSNVEINQIDLSYSRKGKDFGCGFYLNANKQQAMEMAIRTANRMRSGSPIVSAFEFDDSILSKNELNVKVFEGYSVDWAEFILTNRKNKSDHPVHSYDIVIGPIADDTVGVQIRRFVMGYISIEKLIEELRYRGNQSVQYFFASEIAINLLKKVEL